MSYRKVISLKEIRSVDDINAIKKKLKPIIYDFMAFICFHIGAELYTYPDSESRVRVDLWWIYVSIKDVKELSEQIDLFSKNKKK